MTKYAVYTACAVAQATYHPHLNSPVKGEEGFGWEG